MTRRQTQVYTRLGTPLDRDGHVAPRLVPFSGSRANPRGPVPPRRSVVDRVQVGPVAIPRCA